MGSAPQTAEAIPWFVDARAVVIESGFGILWFGWGRQAPPSWLSPLLLVGAAACLATLVLGIVQLVRGRGVAVGPPPRGVRSRYWLLVAGEGVLALGGAVVLGRLGQPGLIAALICFVVDLHFVPMSVIYPGRGLVVLGVVVMLVAALAAAVALTTGGVSSTVAGPGAGLCLLVHALVMLVRSRRARVA